MLKDIVHFKSENAISLKKSDRVGGKCAFQTDMKKLEVKLNGSTGTRSTGMRSTSKRSAPERGLQNATKDLSHRPMFVVHPQPDVLTYTGEDGSFPIRGKFSPL